MNNMYFGAFRWTVVMTLLLAATMSNSLKCYQTYDCKLNGKWERCIKLDWCKDGKDVCKYLPTTDKPPKLAAAGNGGCGDTFFLGFSVPAGKDICRRMRSGGDLVHGYDSPVVAVTPCYCREDGCNNYAEWGGEDMRTGPAFRPTDPPPTTIPPTTTTTTPIPDGGGNVVIVVPTRPPPPPRPEPPSELQCFDVPWTIDGKKEMVLKTCDDDEKLCSYTLDFQGIYKAYGCANKDWVVDSEKYNETTGCQDYDSLKFCYCDESKCNEYDGKPPATTADPDAEDNGNDGNNGNNGVDEKGKDENGLDGSNNWNEKGPGNGVDFGPIGDGGPIGNGGPIGDVLPRVGDGNKLRLSLTTLIPGLLYCFEFKT